MRDGTRTVLSMQNDYSGPPENFALVIPVPVVLGKDDVKVLPDGVFDRVDRLAAPRLVEYWEQDPCQTYQPYMETTRDFTAAIELSPTANRDGAGRHGVEIEAQFEVGEYEVVILSAQDSTGLEKWLRQQKYNIPKGARKLLEPYVASGSKFFVAKVDVSKAKFRVDEQGVRRAELSPLRFHYDSPEFSLPVRLGLINAQGPQDLLVHILGRHSRYEVANRDNVSAPTNVDVKEEVRERFGTFYASLFDHVLTKNPGAVVTEYAWAANSCDPCPEPPLSLEELMTLGVDVLPSYATALASGDATPLQWTIPAEFVLTRLHARYDSDSLGEDLVFQAAPAIVGGSEWRQPDGTLDTWARPTQGDSNNFQARYVIRHQWEGAIECNKPKRGIWGGPWEGSGEAKPIVARELAFVEREAPLEELVVGGSMGLPSVPYLPAGPDYKPLVVVKNEPTAGCVHCSTGEDDGWLGLLGLGMGLGLVYGRRASRTRTRPARTKG